MRLLSVKETWPETFEYTKPATHCRICVFDCETDPFAYGASIKPFTCGFFDGEEYIDFWGDDCIDQFARYMDTRRGERLLIYAHNLGGFDIHFLYDYFDEGRQPLIIGARIAKAYLLGQEWRDSLKIVPVALREFQKDEFDYDKNKRENREAHKDEIRLYQRHDCEYLYTLCQEFHATFGNRITIGNTAINMLESFYGFKRLSARQDANVRDFFFGGRNQCFEYGVLEDDWQVYDVNSMYPYVMAAFKHPIGGVIHNSKTIGDDTFFIEADCLNNGCLPVRTGSGDLDFSVRSGRFFFTIHELNAGLETGDVRILKLRRALNIHQSTDFSAFVNHFYDLRLKAKADKDRVREIFYKLILNSAYGKFAQNPERYNDYVIVARDSVPNGGMFHTEENPNGWKPKYDTGRHIVWSRDSESGAGRRLNYFNVATGASITGAARAELHRGIRLSDRPVYCDTDSIICRRLGSRLDQGTLGAWKLEAQGSRMAIAGKKLYALFDDNGNVVKKASKGANLTGDQIRQVAEGGTIEYLHDIPTFKLPSSVGNSGEHFEYIKRMIQRTGV